MDYRSPSKPTTEADAAQRGRAAAEYRATHGQKGNPTPTPAPEQMSVLLMECPTGELLVAFVEAFVAEITARGFKTTQDDVQSRLDWAKIGFTLSGQQSPHHRM